MSDFKSPQVRIAPELPEFLAMAKKLEISDFITQALPLQSVAEYNWGDSYRGKDFPRASEHFVLADYLIDNPIIAVDLGAISSTYGRVVAYSYGEHWVVGNSISEFAQRLEAKREDAVWGIS